MFITFEGIDGSGKTTQIQLLARYFEAKGKDVIIIREPGGTIFSEKIREILLSKENDLNSVSELFLFESARADLVEKVIIPALANGKIVLCDRFFDSTTAYQSYGRMINFADVTNCNLLATSGLKPDITLFLDVSMEISHQRSKYRERDRMESSGDDFFNRVKEGFHQIAQKEPERIFVIDSSGDINDTQEKIMFIINKFKI
jgi:dTMP kinase